MDPRIGIKENQSHHQTSITKLRVVSEEDIKQIIRQSFFLFLRWKFSREMILWQEGVFLGSALSSLSPPLHFPGEGDFGHFFTGPVELSLSLLYVEYNDVDGRLLKQ